MRRPRIISPDELPALLQPGMRVFVQGCSGQSALFSELLSTYPSSADGVCFSGVLIPGVNRYDYAAVHANASMELFFLSPDFRASYEAGKISYLPIPYSLIYSYLANGPRFDLAFIQISPPDKQGQCSLGYSADFVGAALANCKAIVAHINPHIPHTNAPGVSYAHIDHAIVHEAPILNFSDEKFSGTIKEVGERIASRISDGDTLQFGLGKIQASVLNALKQHRHLKIHSGMISDPLVDLEEAGALSQEPGAVRTGVALGTERLYSFIRHNTARFSFCPVDMTHSAGTLANIDNFVSINSIIEIDLLGQANAETIDGKQISGAGGLVDFIRGAKLAKNGRSILALPATVKAGTRSRIVPNLPAGCPVSVNRGDVDIVVSEYGCADLRHRDVEQRAQSLISIAAPEFQETLQEAWQLMRRQL